MDMHIFLVAALIFCFTKRVMSDRSNFLQKLTGHHQVDELGQWILNSQNLPRNLGLPGDIMLVPIRSFAGRRNEIPRQNNIFNNAQTTNRQIELDSNHVNSNENIFPISENGYRQNIGQPSLREIMFPLENNNFVIEENPSDLRLNHIRYSKKLMKKSMFKIRNFLKELRDNFTLKS